MHHHGISRLCHFHDLRTIHNTLQAFGVDHAVLLAGQQFVPPAKEEIAGDELEPRRERIPYEPRTQHTSKNTSNVSLGIP